MLLTHLRGDRPVSVKRIAITPEQAQYLAHKLNAAHIAEREAQAAKSAASEWLGFVIAGHAPAGSAFVSVDTEDGWVTVQPPAVVLPVEHVADVDETGG
jgi:hypothetical protein